MVTFPLFQPFALGEGDALPVMLGNVKSMLMPVWDELAELPALSRQTPVTDWLAPSPRVVGGGELETPDKPSVQVKLTVTATLFHPLELAAGDLELVIEGAVLSILIPETVPDPVFPALSVQLALLDWPEPSDETSCGVTGPVATPERESVQLNVTVTSPLFQPFEFGEGEVKPVTTGLVSSIFTTTEAEPVSPAWFVAVQVTVVPDVSEVKVTVPHPEEEATFDSGSTSVQLIVTLTLFHPLMFGVGVSEGVITGGLVSVPKSAVNVNGALTVRDDLGLLVELSLHEVKKYPVPGPPLMVLSTPMVPVEEPELSHAEKGAVSDEVPEDAPFKYTAVGWDDWSPVVWMVSRYWVCQFHVMLEAAFIVKVTVLDAPAAGMLPVPVHPVVTYWTPVAPAIGEVTASVIDDPASIHPLTGVGVSWADVTVRKYWCE
jgi:hypothetical protein